MHCSHQNPDATPTNLGKAILILLTFALLLPCGILQAEQGDLGESDTEWLDDRRWYQIEVLIFAQGEALAGMEYWRDNPALSYPTHWVTLKDSNQLANTLKTLNSDQRPPSYDISTPTDAPEIADPVPTTGQQSIADPVEGEVNSEGAPLFLDRSVVQDAQTAALEHVEMVDYDREPFYLLPEQLQSLSEKVSQIRRSRNYRVLFHGAWRQPLVAPDQSPAILIKGGKQFDQHYELEGSITIGVSRYLHLSTNLWFTQFTDNYGQQSNWPPLPPSPDLTIINEFASAGIGDWMEQTETLDSETMPAVTSFATGAINASDATTFTTLVGGELSIGSRYQQLLNRPFLPERITLMQQKRRMRSGEVHYLDHPHLGIVVLCKPHETAATEELQPDME